MLLAGRLVERVVDEVVVDELSVMVVMEVEVRLGTTDWQATYRHRTST